jgi:phosphatidylglycerophosphatase A
MNSEAEDVTDLVRTDGTITPLRPTFDFMKPRLSRWIALGFGSGLSATAPGTVGTIFGWASFALLHVLLGDIGMVLLCALGLVVGVWAVARVGRDLGVPDHSAMVWDEVVAFWLVLLLVPPTFASQLVAFLLFRAFDILKPPPIRQVDRLWKTPFGVMADDLLAGAYTVLVIAFWQRLA